MKLKLYTGSSRAICSIMCGSDVTVKRQAETRLGFICLFEGFFFCLFFLLRGGGQNEVILKSLIDMED